MLGRAFGVCQGCVQLAISTVSFIANIWLQKTQWLFKSLNTVITSVNKFKAYVLNNWLSQKFFIENDEDFECLLCTEVHW